MIEVRVQRDVARAPDEVFAYWADWTNNPSWQNGMVSCTWTSAPPLQVGSTYDQEARFLGTTVSATIRGEPQGVMKLFEPLAQKMVERNVNADYDRLKAMLDGETEDGRE